MQTIIADDELHSREVLKLLLQMHCPDVHVAAECASADEAESAILAHKPRLVFLDIEMPGKNVFDMLAGIQHLDFHVVFTTAYDQYAIKAIKHNALDYLLKPIDADELKASVKKAVTQPAKQSAEQLKDASRKLTGPDDAFRLSIPTAEGHYFIPTGDLLYCEGQSNYTKLHLTRGRTVMCAKTLKDFEETLQPHGFMRIHKSILANLIYVEKLLPGKHIAVLTNGTQIEVSRRKKDELFNVLFNR